MSDGVRKVPYDVRKLSDEVRMVSDGLRMCQMVSGCVIWCQDVSDGKKKLLDVVRWFQEWIIWCQKVQRRCREGARYCQEVVRCF